MYIRQATRNDLGGVLECLRELNKKHVDYFNSGRVKHLLKTKCTAVCVNTRGDIGDIMGVCIIEDNHDDTMEIFAIAVKPVYQKHFGVGSKLLRWAEAMAIGCDREIIYADSYKFYNATPFYTKNGYERQEAGFGYTFYKYVEFPIGHQYTLKF